MILAQQLICILPLTRSLTLCLLCLVSLVSGCDSEEGKEGDAAGEIAGGSLAGAMSTGGVSGGGETGGDSSGVASCTMDEDCPPGTLCDEGRQACRDACDQDSECGATSICQSGFCQVLEPCEGGVEGTCLEGSTCDCRGLCIPLVGNPCRGDLQCQVSDYCDPCKGQCLPRSLPCEACTSDVSCERSADVCVPVGARGEEYCLRACTGQGACDNLGAGYVCDALGGRGTFCLPEAGECTALRQCERDVDCVSGSFCNERGQCQPGCVNDISCSEGLVCQGLRCAPLCTGPSDCTAEGAVCESDGRCRIPGGCQSSRDCTEPETYCDLNTLRCVDGCQIDDDCLDANKECVAGRCRPRGCSRNYQCSFGEVCDVERSLCVMAEGRHCEAGCDPSASETSCGSGGQRCLSLQDAEENPLGDFCFEPCQPEPNECPQGYSCETIEDGSGSSFSLCIRQCDIPSMNP